MPLKLWKVGSQFILADGPAGAVYLANDFRNKPMLLRTDVYLKSKPQAISKHEAESVLNA